jgi:hypothetical protein
MPHPQALRSHLSEQSKQGLPQCTFTEEELGAYLRTAMFDGGRIHRYVEGQNTRGFGRVTDLQQSIEQEPATLLDCLREIARIERPEKRAIKSYLRTNLPANTPEPLLDVLREALEAIPEQPTFEEVPRFTLPGWEEPDTSQHQAPPLPSRPRRRGAVDLSSRLRLWRKST